MRFLLYCDCYAIRDYTKHKYVERIFKGINTRVSVGPSGQAVTRAKIEIS